MLTVVCADKGSPGVSTTAWALAASWPTEAVLVEADPAGGDLAIRYRHGRDRPLASAATVATLAAESARTTDPSALVRRLAQPVPGLAGAVPGFLTAEQGAAIDGLWTELADTLGDAGVDVVVDVGRFDSRSAAAPLVHRADAVVVVLQPSLASVLHTRERITHLHDTPGVAHRRLIPTVVSTVRTAAADCCDVHDVLAERDLDIDPAHIGWDPGAVERLVTGDDPRGRLTRTVLLRTARTLADRIAISSDTALADASAEAVS